MLGFFGKKEPKTAAPIEPIKIPKDDGEIPKIADFFQQHTGVCFQAQPGILRSKLTTFCRHRKIESFASLLAQVRTQDLLRQELINALTTNESHFYREFKQIGQLVELVKACQKPVQSLCAPSATGEEPYSIAIALLEGGVKDFAILGIDINSDATEHAKRGIYGVRTLQKLPEALRQRYFTPESNTHYAISSQLKSCVTFRVVNLFEPEFLSLGKFEFIFCRNMLIYFDPPTKKKAIERLESLLSEPRHPIFFGHADLF